MALAMAVMRDVNLSVRVLKLANTPMFNPKDREIASLSRAVVLLGFERILNLAMTIKLVESLRADKPDKVLDQLLVQTFLNASIACELAEAANLRKAEGVHLNGFLRNLGEILVAYTLPDRHQKIRDLLRKGEAGWSEAQLQLLGAEFSDIGQEFAEEIGLFLHARDEKHGAEAAHSPAPPIAQRSSVDLLEALPAFNTLIAQDAPATQLVEALMRAVLDNSGLERSLFLIKEPSKAGALVARLAAGGRAPALGSKLSSLADPASSRLFNAVAQTGTTLMLNDLSSAA